MQNPVITFPIKERINTELFIDKTAALYIVDGRIKEGVNHCYWLSGGLSKLYAGM